MTDSNVNVLDILDAIEENLEKAQAAAARVNYGKLGISEVAYKRFVQDEEKQWAAVPVSAEEFKTHPRGAVMEITFCVDIQEFQPDLEFTYERRVTVGREDWREILVPSIEAIMGEGSMDKKASMATLRNLIGEYICAEDVPQVETPEYNTLSIVEVFADRDACYQAWRERFGNDDDEPKSKSKGKGKSASGAPEGFSPAEWDEEYPSIRKMHNKGKTIEEIAEFYGVDVVYIERVIND